MADSTDLASPFIQGMLSGQSYKMNQIKLQEAPIKLEEEKLALKIAQSDFSKRQQMADMLAKDPDKVPPGQDPLQNASNSLLRMGTAAAKVGLVEEAVTDLSKASTIASQQTEAAYKNWQMASQKAKYADQLLSGVTDQQTFDAMNAHIKMTTGQPSQYEGKKYDPKLIEDLKNAAATHRTKAQEDLTKAEEKRAEVETQIARERIPLMKTQEALNVARTNAATKVGGDGLIAKPATVSAATSAIIADNPNIERDAARTFADDIALDAEDRMKRDGQTRPQAIAAAVKYAKDHGKLAGIATAHQGPGSSPKKPRPLPTDVSGYKNQMWYQAPDGPRWYDEETKSLYKPGEGPGDENEGAEEEDDK
jgi:hypothetical protein